MPSYISGDTIIGVVIVEVVLVQVVCNQAPYYHARTDVRAYLQVVVVQVVNRSVRQQGLNHQRADEHKFSSATLNGGAMLCLEPCSQVHGITTCKITDKHDHGIAGWGNPNTQSNY